ncbi:hypothetical protein L9F63_024468, partial [Diploptera punctata]
MIRLRLLLPVCLKCVRPFISLPTIRIERSKICGFKTRPRYDPFQDLWLQNPAA